MKAETGRLLLAHYAVPLIDATARSTWSFKTGAYTGCREAATRSTWSVQRSSSGSTRQLEAVWTFESDWKPEPLDADGLGVGLPAGDLGPRHLRARASAARCIAWPRETGISEGRINPVHRRRPDALRRRRSRRGPGRQRRLQRDRLFRHDRSGGRRGRLARARRARERRAVARELTRRSCPARRGAGDPCQAQFRGRPAPWPPTPDRRAADGLLRLAAPRHQRRSGDRAGRHDLHGQPGAPVPTATRYLVAVHPDLTPAWSASLRGILNDGCGVLRADRRHEPRLPHGRARRRRSRRPTTSPPGRVRDAGTVLPGRPARRNGAHRDARRRYNYARGHLFKFNAQGGVLATYDFGWDITPAVFGTTARTRS